MTLQRNLTNIFISDVMITEKIKEAKKKGLEFIRKFSV